MKSGVIGKNMGTPKGTFGKAYGVKLGTRWKHENKVLEGRTLLGTCKEQNPKTHKKSSKPSLP
jgi:hypothetical protein